MTTTIILSFLRPLLMAWFITHFTPIQTVIDWMYVYVPDYLKFTRSPLMCFKCMTFWMTLILTLNPLLSMAFAMFAFTYDKIMNGIKTYL